jgi:hypothetical protein
MHKYDDMFFSLLDNELGEDFYKSKIRLNLTLKPPSQMFMEMLQRWIENINLAAMRMKAILLEFGQYMEVNMEVPLVRIPS